MHNAAGERLRLERLRLGKSQAELSELSGVHRNSLAAYETGKSSIPVDYLLLLTEHGLDAGYVVTGARQDGTLGLEDTLLIEMFRKLPENQRAALVQLVMAMTNSSIDPTELKRFNPNAE